MNINLNANLYGTNATSYGYPGAWSQGDDSLTQLLQQLGGALQNPEASAVDVLGNLLDTLGNSNDPSLQQLAEDCTSSDDYASGAGTDESRAYALLQQLYSALAEYRQAQQASQQYPMHSRGAGFGVSGPGFGY